MHALPRMTVAVAAIALALSACGDDGNSGADDGDGSISFATPADGATVTSPVSLTFTADGVTILPAGEEAENSGHFHVMVDVACVTEGEVIPKDDQHVHFGDGSTSAELELEPGEHTLCLQIGDGIHTATTITDEITITVE